MEEIKNILSEYSDSVEKYLADYYDRQAGIPNKLCKAMLYTLMAGGKRIRPVLCLNWYKLLEDNWRKILPFASAIEMIHTYSLIHDDLPAMDDDELRRGKPTCHIKFDEATAILAGDALLTDAFQVALETAAKPELVIKSLKKLAFSCGSSGMVGGQILDMQEVASCNQDIDNLKKMEEMKTGALISASCECGIMLANGTEKQIEAARIYGICIGRAFQIVDDILDITGNPAEMGKNFGSDKKLGKQTWPDLLGIEESYRIAKNEISKAFMALSIFPSEKTCFLKMLGEYIISRKK